jgi:hypothetical protein
MDPYLEGMGLTTTPVGEEFAQNFCVPIDQGLLISPSGCPAQWDEFEPLLLPWDIIVECNGEKVYDLPDLASEEVEGELDLSVFRQGKFVKVALPILSGEYENRNLTGFSYKHTIQGAVYYMDGESVWDEHTLLETGDGIITGRVMISGKPAEGVDISIFLAGNKQTQPAVTDSDGRFEVRLPTGRYFYIGYELSGPNAPGQRMISVDRNLPPYRRRKPSAPSTDSDALSKRFSELASEFGPEEAAKKLGEEFEMDLKNLHREKYPLEVASNRSVSIPDIIYMEPVQIVSPLYNSSITLDQLTFAWVPYAGADSYYVVIHHIDRKPRTEVHSPILWQTVYSNSLSINDIEYENKEHFSDDRVREIIPGERYTLQVFAYDKDDNVLSASSEHSGLEFLVK